MCAAISRAVFGQQEGRWGDEYDGTRKKIKYDAQGRQLYPDSTANMQSGGASASQQSGMKIGGPDGQGGSTSGGGSTGGLKGDAPLTDNAGSGGGSGGTGDINY